MKGYKIEHNENSNTDKPEIIEQCNFHGLQKISFYGWAEDNIESAPIIQTVAIFKIKWKQ